MYDQRDKDPFERTPNPPPNAGAGSTYGMPTTPAGTSIWPGTQTPGYDPGQDSRYQYQPPTQNQVSTDPTAIYEYYPDGLPRKATFANGTVAEYEYYDNGWLYKAETTKPATGELISRYEYEYDDYGSPSVKKEWNVTPAYRVAHPDWSTRPPRVTTYDYDNLGRLTGEHFTDGITGAPSRHVAYTYDKVGNRLTEVERRSNPTTGTRLKDFTYTYNTRNQVVYVRDNLRNDRPSSQSYRFEYNNSGDVTAKIFGHLDPQGNIIPGTETERYVMVWDVAGKLRRVTYKTATEEKVVAEYRYDYQGRRVAKESTLPLATGGGTTRDTRMYVYDDKAVLSEYKPGPTPSAPIQKVSQNIYGGNSLVATEQAKSDGSGVQTVYHHQDRLGSTVNLTDAGGNVAKSYLYDGWGNARELEANGQTIGDPDIDPEGLFNAQTYAANVQNAYQEDQNRFTFTGHEFDPETDLYYAKARFYDPGLGRFNSEDPFLGKQEEPPSLHRYLYAFSNPIRYVDTTGLYNISLPIDSRTRELLVANSNNVAQAQNALKTSGRYKAGTADYLKIDSDLIAMNYYNQADDLLSKNSGIAAQAKKNISASTSTKDRAEIEKEIDYIDVYGKKFEDNLALAKTLRERYGVGTIERNKLDRAVDIYGTRGDNNGVIVSFDPGYMDPAGIDPTSWVYDDKTGQQKGAMIVFRPDDAHLVENISHEGLHYSNHARWISFSIANPSGPTFVMDRPPDFHFWDEVSAYHASFLTNRAKTGQGGTQLLESFTTSSNGNKYTLWDQQHTYGERAKDISGFIYDRYFWPLEKANLQAKYINDPRFNKNQKLIDKQIDQDYKNLHNLLPDSKALHTFINGGD